MARSGEPELTTALKKSLPKVRGAYAFVLMTPEQLIGLRDPHGIRPLSLGKTPSGYVLASETCAFDTIGAEFVRDIEPGEMVTIDRNGLHFEKFAPAAPHAMCIFEFIYFARADSNLLGKNVHLVRKRLGRRLAAEHPVEADLVAGVPDSSLSVASGVAEQLGLPYEMGFNKNRYIGRTFIQPTPELRTLGVQLKLNPVWQIVAGNGSLSSMIPLSGDHPGTLWRCSARPVPGKSICGSSPPVIAPCCYGLEISSPTELIAARMSVDEIAANIGADSLGFLSEEGLLEAVDLPAEGFCQACFNGCYLVKADDQWDLDHNGCEKEREVQS